MMEQGALSSGNRFGVTKASQLKQLPTSGECCTDPLTLLLDTAIRKGHKPE